VPLTLGADYLVPLAWGADYLVKVGNKGMSHSGALARSEAITFYTNISTPFFSALGTWHLIQWTFRSSMRLVVAVRARNYVRSSFSQWALSRS